jgi:exonuclease SbcD
LSDEVREVFPHAVKVIIESSLEPPERTKDSARRDRSPHELFENYLAERGISDDRLVTMFHELYEEAHATDPA